ncbi:MAG: hypothetical protein CMJ83_04910 [Planctomycetes bacterium]|nr:hypothetical protein [Planctomycetota bacterium]
MKAKRDPPAMLFWELISAFGSEETIVREVVSEARWREPYLAWVDNFAELVDTQDRAVLDAPVPLALSRSVADRSSLHYVYDWFSRHLRCVETKRAYVVKGTALTAVEVHDRFGGSVIEEAHEKGAAVIP